ncbi:hypothetical protein ABZZ44_33505 [Streptomyces sp. NPDC006460]|uniref:hypothetical protein n=1 Tax=Streptomyces sp. NPDC006460 TaxID=3154304 RepID=UPI0033B1754E
MFLGALGVASIAAAEQQVSAVRRARSARARRLKKDLEVSQRERYAAATRAEPPRQLGALTGVQAEAELAQSADASLSQLALPDVVPPAAPPADWRTPASLAALTTPGPLVPHPPGRDGASAPPGRDGRAAPPTTDEDGDAL